MIQQRAIDRRRICSSANRLNEVMLPGVVEDGDEDGEDVVYDRRLVVDDR